MYDAVGDMTCRAADGATTCSSTPTGAKLDYDNAGRLSSWQNAPSSPTTTDDFLYDGEGNRVEQQATISGSAVTTVYIAGGLEEVTTSGATTTLTKYFSAAGLPTIERVGTNGPLSYLASDGQGSVSETLDGSGAVTFQQLYTPYGVSRYSNGSSPTSLGYTGQRADSSTGLDFYQARYYDPLAGQFTSADSVADGLNRYGYVAGNPTTNSDPSGRRICYDGDASSCVPNGSPPPPPPDCHTTNTCTTTSGGSGGDGVCNSRCQHKGVTPTPCDQKCIAAGIRQKHRTDYRMGKIKELEGQLGVLRALRDGAYLTADIIKLLLHISKARVLDALLDGLDLVAQGTTVLKDVGDLIGGEFQHAMNQVGAALQGIMGVLMFIRGIISTPFVGEIVQNAFLMIASYFMPMLEGPLGIVLYAVELTAGGAIADLVSAGGHVVDFIIQEKEDEVLRDQQMSLDDFCRHDGGCPAS